MKIAYLSPNFPPILGGMGTACYYTANEIGKSHSVTVFLANRNVGYQKGNYKIKLIEPWLIYGHGHLMPQVLWLLKDFDIVHIYYPYFGTVEFVLLRNMFSNKFSNKKPKIILHHAMEAVGEGFWKEFFKFYTEFITPILIKKADQIFILSKDYAENSDVTKIYKKYPGKFREVPHGVDLEKFVPSVIPAQAGIQNKQKESWIPNQVRDDKNGNFIIFTAQALDKQHFFKGIDILIKTIKILSVRKEIPRDPSAPRRIGGSLGINCKLMIAGDGPLKKHYQKMAHKLGIADKVKFLGQINHDKLPDYYNLADITAVPSTARTECFSLTAVESMACGTPVIVSDWPGVRVTIENNKSGLIVIPGDEKNLAEKIKYLYNNPDKLRLMGENARQRVEEKYDWEEISGQIIQNYKELLA